MFEEINKSFDTISENFKKVKTLTPTIEEVCRVCIEALKNGNKIMFCGNGGSAADSQHLAAELVGRYKMNRPALNSIALTTDTSILTAVGNDFGYDTIFERQVEGLGKKGDVLIGLSTSGNSKNVLLAMQLAKKMGIKTVAMTGENGGKMKQQADFAINVPSDVTNNIQEMHIAIGHIICGFIEKELAPKTKALFLDRDGTINVDFGYTFEPEKLEFIDGIFELCHNAQNNGYKIIVITNQSGVARGYYSVEQMNNFNEYMKQQFKNNGVDITEFYCCPHLDEKHPDRKPNAGMFLKAQSRYNIDMKNSVAVGDKERDVEAAINAGVGKCYLFDADKKQPASKGTVVAFLKDIKF